MSVEHRRFTEEGERTPFGHQNNGDTQGPLVPPQGLRGLCGVVY